MMVPYAEVPARIKESLTLSTVILAAGVDLKRKGREWVGLCPFHDEKTPSFSVNDEKGLYYCRGCHATGDVISFHAHFYSVKPGQAIKHFSDQLGFVVEPRQRGGRSGRDATNPPRVSWDTGVLLAINEAAQGVLSLIAQSSAQYHCALSSRGISSEAARAFGLGYYPPGWSLLDALVDSGEVPLSREQIRLGCHELGLLHPHSDHSAFEGRLIFPITDESGAVVGFSGRALAEDVRAKYINSPDSAVFDKSHLLYGLAPIRRLASEDSGIRRYWQSIKAGAHLYVVEGYTDVIALAEAGLRAVAGMGTGFSERQVALLVREGLRLRCLYDADPAGLRALDRTLLTVFPALTDRHRLFGLLLPSGHDPDSFVREVGLQAAASRLDALERRQPETVWWAHHIGKLSQPPSLADQVVVERAYSDKGSYPSSPLWRLLMARHIERVCGYRVRSPEAERQRLPWSGSSEAAKVLASSDSVAKLWLSRFRRRPDLIASCCARFRHRWWVDDLLCGRMDPQAIPLELTYIFAADRCLAGVVGAGELSWDATVRALLDNGFPAHWLKGWGSEAATVSDDPAPVEVWPFEWGVWVDALNDSAANRLISALEQPESAMLNQ